MKSLSPTRKTVADLQHTTAALERAARRARLLAEQTDTPFLIFRDGKIINLRDEQQSSPVTTTEPDAAAQ